MLSSGDSSEIFICEVPSPLFPLASFCDAFPKVSFADSLSFWRETLVGWCPVVSGDEEEAGVCGLLVGRWLHLSVTF